MSRIKSKRAIHFWVVRLYILVLEYLIILRLKIINILKVYKLYLIYSGTHSVFGLVSIWCQIFCFSDIGTVKIFVNIDLVLVLVLFLYYFGSIFRSQFICQNLILFVQFVLYLIINQS